VILVFAKFLFFFAGMTLKFLRVISHGWTDGIVGGNMATSALFGGVS
jgi:hypothetical protein